MGDDPAPQSDVPDSFAAALRELASCRDIDEILQRAVEVAREHVVGCDLADVMFVGHGGVTTPVSTEQLARQLDDLQGEVGEGPCLSAARDDQVVIVTDLASDGRFPKFAPRAVDLGIAGAVSYQLFLDRHDGDRFGALNLYSRRPCAFGATAVADGEILAALCATALAAAISREGAHAALESRDRIGQAKGILMERHQMTAADAFDVLRRSSQELNLKLRDVADHVARTGQLP